MPPAPPPRVALAVFAAAAFGSAFLLFLVQPLFGRMVLPRLGGSPAVWNACMLFFQAALLGGYLYAHLSSRRFGVRRQVALHLALLALAALALPLSAGARELGPGESPVLWLLRAMALSVGPPFLVLAGTGPLLQRWFSHSGHAHAADPYPLYAASNLGSALALLAYPALLEPRLRLAEQSGVWAAGYALLGLGVAAAGLGVARRPVAPPEVGLAEGGAGEGGGPWVWVALSFVPSSLLLGATSYLTTDLVPMPLLWVLPLGLYLLSFTLVFARRPPLPHRWMLAAQPTLLALVAISLLGRSVGRPSYALAIHLAALFVTAMVCHGELARRRPPVQRLTAFYLWLSVGGVLGGVFNVLVAPVIFVRNWEYPLVVVLACLARPADPEWRPRSRQLLAAACAGGVAWSLLWATRQDDLFGLLPLLMAGAALLVVGVGLAGAPRWLAVALCGALLGRSAYQVRTDGTLHATRSFFGAYRVAHNPYGAGFHVLTHGSTLHGAQSLDPARRREPLTYYMRTGPLGQAFARLAAPPGRRRVAFVGLGTGTAAALGSRGDHFTFYEIDPGMERIARDTALFTYVADSPARVDVVIGDARVRLAGARGAQYDLIALDAFTSDAVPTHLLTREALAAYRERLAPGGFIVYHVSNRYLDLEAVVARLAQDAGMAVRMGSGPAGRLGAYEQYSTWMVLARTEGELARFQGLRSWSTARLTRPLPVWTDDYSSVLSVMQW